MKKLLALLLFVGISAWAQTPVAVVNGEPITKEELDSATRLNQILFQPLFPVPAIRSGSPGHPGGEGLPGSLPARGFGEFDPPEDPASRSSGPRAYSQCSPGGRTCEPGPGLHQKLLWPLRRGIGGGACRRRVDPGAIQGAAC